MIFARFHCRSSDDLLNVIAVSNRPLKYNELFEVKVEEISSKSEESMAIGVTTNKPDDIKFQRTILSWSKGLTWLYRDISIMETKDGTWETLRELNTDLREVKVALKTRMLLPSKLLQDRLV